jgi:hypothetical protein
MKKAILRGEYCKGIMKNETNPRKKDDHSHVSGMYYGYVDVFAALDPFLGSKEFPGLDSGLRLAGQPE